MSWALDSCCWYPWRNMMRLVLQCGKHPCKMGPAVTARVKTTILTLVGSKSLLFWPCCLPLTLPHWQSLTEWAGKWKWAGKMWSFSTTARIIEVNLKLRDKPNILSWRDHMIKVKLKQRQCIYICNKYFWGTFYGVWNWLTQPLFALPPTTIKTGKQSPSLSLSLGSHFT